MKTLYILISFILISTASFGQELIYGKKEGPQFTFKKQEVVVTDAILKETKIIKIPFINDGTETLIFENKNASSNCIVAYVPKEVKAGAESELILHFTANRIGNYNETVYIETNAKKIPMLFGFKATVE